MFSHYSRIKENISSDFWIEYFINYEYRYEKYLLGVSFSETEYIIMCYTFSEKSTEIITKIIRALSAYYMNCQKIYFVNYTSYVMIKLFFLFLYFFEP